MELIKVKIKILLIISLLFTILGCSLDATISSILDIPSSNSQPGNNDGNSGEDLYQQVEKFSLNIPGTITSIVKQNNKMYIGGKFSAVGKIVGPSVYFSSINGDLENLSSIASVDGKILDSAVDSQGRIYIRGLFSSVSGVPRYNFARLNADGSLDESFPDLGIKESFVNTNGSYMGVKVLGSTVYIIGKYLYEVLGQRRDGAAAISFNLNGEVQLSSWNPKLRDVENLTLVGNKVQISASRKNVRSDRYSYLNLQTGEISPPNNHLGIQDQYLDKIYPEVNGDILYSSDGFFRLTSNGVRSSLGQGIRPIYGGWDVDGDYIYALDNGPVRTQGYGYRLYKINKNTGFEDVLFNSSSFDFADIYNSTASVSVVGNTIFIYSGGSRIRLNSQVYLGIKIDKITGHATGWDWLDANFSFPLSAKIIKNGNSLYVCDIDSIKKLNATGDEDLSFISPAISSINGCDFDDDGRLYVWDFKTNSLADVFVLNSTTGTLLRTVVDVVGTNYVGSSSDRVHFSDGSGLLTSVRFDGQLSSRVVNSELYPCNFSIQESSGYLCIEHEISDFLHNGIYVYDTISGQDQSEFYHSNWPYFGVYYEDTEYRVLVGDELGIYKLKILDITNGSVLAEHTFNGSNYVSEISVFRNADKLYVKGKFEGIAGHLSPYLVAVNLSPTFSVDTAFSSRLTYGADPWYGLALSDIAVINGKLVACGFFDAIGGGNQKNIAFLDLATGDLLQDQIDYHQVFLAQSSVSGCRSLTTIGSDLIHVGMHDAVLIKDSQAVENLIEVDLANDNSVLNLGAVGGMVTSLAIEDGRLYIGGSGLTSLSGVDMTIPADGVPSQCLGVIDLSSMTVLEDTGLPIVVPYLGQGDTYGGVNSILKVGNKFFFALTSGSGVVAGPGIGLDSSLLVLNYNPSTKNFSFPIQFDSPSGGSVTSLVHKNGYIYAVGAFDNVNTYTSATGDINLLTDSGFKNFAIFDSQGSLVSTNGISMDSLLAINHRETMKAFFNGLKLKLIDEKIYLLGLQSLNSNPAHFAELSIDAVSGLVTQERTLNLDIHPLLGAALTFTFEKVSEEGYLLSGFFDNKQDLTRLNYAILDNNWSLLGTQMENVSEVDIYTGSYKDVNGDLYLVKTNFSSGSSSIEIIK